MTKKIHVKGAREHNLKNISLSLPREKLIIFTGPSGSGKSSLAFDTIYAEGQRRYVESLSAYARQFLELMQKPDVDAIEGLSPAISIEQKTTSKNPRSTVGTVTEIYDYLRLLFARVGVPYSPATGKEISAQTVTQMVDQLVALTEGTRGYILAPIVRARKGEYRKELADLLKAGYARVKIDGEFYELDDLPKLNKKIKHDIDLVVDRIAIRPGDADRYAQSLETALTEADGLAYFEYADERQDDDSPKRLIFSQRFACPVSGFTIEEIEPRLFSFNNPAGACPACDGLGNKLQFEPDLIVPNPKLSLRDGALVPWAKSGQSSPIYEQTLESLAGHYGFQTTVPYQKLPKKIKDILLFGSGKEEINFLFSDGRKVYEVKRPFEGVLRNIQRRWQETESSWMREELSKFQSSMPCPKCDGHRLRPEALAVKIDQKHIGQVTELSIGDAFRWAENMPDKLSEKQNQIARRILKEILERLKFLNDVGLEYLTMSRTSGTLSGGESQRIRLASQIGSGLTGVLYVLDEPSIGLHQRDNEKLLQTLKHLRDIGNTVIVVEHDEDAMRQADHIVDIGPHAGVHGGQIVAEGTAEDIMNNKNSVTGQYLSGKKEIAIPAKRRELKKNHVITIQGASANNLKDIDITLPLGVMTAVTGVSGGGKSSFLIETLYKAAARQLMGAKKLPGPHKKISGLQKIDKVIDISQAPIGRTPRSNPATYTGAFTHIRDWFTGLPEAKARGYKPGRFSFNVKGGRCEACKGDGLIKIEMHFLPDVYVTCDQCQGKRYNRETLEIKFKGKSIADVLDMTVEEGVKFFSAIPSVRNKLETLDRVGLGYIKIGQQATTLSGGEAQRVKLAKELAKRSTGRTLYILDEPTTGLHFDDIAKLLEVLHELVDGGNTIAVIEHNLDVIKTADWIIDIGPEGGSGGGTIVIAGTPEQVSGCSESHTGRFLKPLLQSKQLKKKQKPAA